MARLNIQKPNNGFGGPPDHPFSSITSDNYYAIVVAFYISVELW